MKAKLLTALALALAFTAANAQNEGNDGQNSAGDPVAGERKAVTCMGCHGVPGYRNAYPSFRVPKVGGQSAQYIVLALQAYKAGQRDHATMQAQASSLSEEDMRDIAAYFSQLGESEQ